MRGARGGQLPCGRARAARGFTLIELLVVIAIIVLLVTVLAPGLQGAWRVARTMICSSHLHAIGRAAYLYAADNRNYVPRDFWYAPDAGGPGSSEYGHYFFAWCFSRYVGGPVLPLEYLDGDSDLYAAFQKMPIYRCPSVRDKAYVLTYAANGVDFAVYARSRTYASAAVSRIDDLPGSPGAIAYICEVSLNVPSNSFGVYDFFNPEHFSFWNGIPNPASRTIAPTDKRHAGRTNLAYFDGHTGQRRLSSQDFPNTLLNPLNR